MSRFALLLTLVTAALHLPFYFAVKGLGVPPVLAIALSILGTGLFYLKVSAGTFAKKRARVEIVLFDLPYFVHWCALTLLFLVALIALPFRLGLTFSFSALCANTYLLGLVLSLYGVFIRRHWVVTHRIDVPVRDLPSAFEGFSIAHLSDLHVGTFATLDYAMRWVRRANGLNADIIAVTGDLVASGTAFNGDAAALLAELRAKEHVLVSMGNHDYFGSGEDLIGKIRDRGLRLLINEGFTLERGDAKLFIAGIDDTWTRRADIERTMAGRPDGTCSIVLAHEPNLGRALVKAGADLVLSGHTHGGQIAMPFLARWVSPAKLLHPFNLGLYRVGDSHVYVHPGLGTTGPPVRFGVAPAVTLLTLRRAP